MSDISLSSRRVGKFFIDSQVMEDNPELVLQIMAECIVLRAERMFYRDGVEYVACSRRFRPLPMGEIVPEYRWVIRDGAFAQAEEVK